MSASEKLKALEQAPPGREMRTVCKTLFAALPQIAAAVDSAQLLLEKRKKRARIVYAEEHNLENALASLDEALP